MYQRKWLIRLILGRAELEVCITCGPLNKQPFDTPASPILGIVAFSVFGFPANFRTVLSQSLGGGKSHVAILGFSPFAANSRGAPAASKSCVRARAWL